MRIEGTYTFPAPIEQVFVALTHPDILSQVIPGCERLVQLGPAVGDLPPVYEVRLRRGPGAEVYTLTLTLSTVQSPGHVRADLEGRGPDGPFSGHGLVDLVAKDGHTVAASVWEVKSPVLAGLPAERRTTWHDSAEQFVGGMRGRIVSAASSSGGIRHLMTPRGRVVILPRGGASLSLEQRGQLRRVAWIGSGLLAGAAFVGLILAVARRLARIGDTDDPSDASDS